MIKSKYPKTYRNKKELIKLSDSYSTGHVFYHVRANLSDIPYWLFREIIETCNKQIIKELVENAETFRIPYRLGYWKIKKRQTSFDDKSKIDWGLYHKTGKLVQHVNLHSEGWYGRFFWSKKTAIFQNKSFYCFKPTRPNKQKLSNEFKYHKGHRKYTT